MIYAIADLHGELNLLEKALNAIFEREPGLIITLGDYIDRGPHSKQVIERLMEGLSEDQKSAGWSMVNLAGNHDRWMVDLYCMEGYGFDGAEWLACGGGKTIKSYGGKVRQSRYGVDVPSQLRRHVPRSHINWIRDLPLYHETERFVFVHACVDETKELHDQTEAVLTWALWPRHHEGGYRGKHVVHGHEGIPNGPYVYDGRTNLDTRAYETGRLVIGMFDKDKSEFMEIEA